MEPVIILKNISKKFQEKTSEELLALQHINLEIAPGEFFIFLGPSGSGKSTLLRIMSGLEKLYQGEIKFGPGIRSSDLNFVFQQFALLPWLTVFRNIELGLLSRNVPQDIRKARVEKELKRFSLERFADSFPKELSGGMRQRVGIARALATDPKIIFMDEPFSELDSFTAEELRKEVLTIWHNTKPTIIMVTHLIEEAIELADRIAVFTPRPGKIEKVVVNHLPRPRIKRHPDFYNLEDTLYTLIRP